MNTHTCRRIYIMLGILQHIPTWKYTSENMHFKHIRLHIRVSKLYTNEQWNLSPIHRLLFNKPLRQQLNSPQFRQQKWIDMVHATMQTRHIHEVTNTTHSTYKFGRQHVTSQYHTLFDTPLNKNLRSSTTTQSKWLSTYIITVPSSTNNLHGYILSHGDHTSAYPSTP